MVDEESIEKAKSLLRDVVLPACGVTNAKIIQTSIGASCSFDANASEPREGLQTYRLRLVVMVSNDGESLSVLLRPAVEMTTGPGDPLRAKIKEAKTSGWKDNEELVTWVRHSLGDIEDQYRAFINGRT